MSEEKKSGWEKLLDEISSPWDWIAGGAGATLGAGITTLLGGTDLGTSMAAGATAGVAARKAITASFRGRQLKRRANGLEAIIKNHIMSVSSQAVELDQLLKELNRERVLWEHGAISNDDFAKQLDELVSKYRQVKLRDPEGE